MGRMERGREKRRNSRERSCLFSRVFIQRFVPRVAHGQWPVSTFPVWKQGNNDVHGREGRKEDGGGGEKTREIIVSNNNGNTIKHSSSFLKRNGGILKRHSFPLILGILWFYGGKTFPSLCIILLYYSNSLFDAIKLSIKITCKYWT